jgi:uncharacterized protein YndB with AHSA1/START domain
MVAASEIAAGPELRITRLYDAPRQLVFDAWTMAEHLEQWQGAPMGFSVTVAESDIRPGGRFRLCMRSPDGVDHWLQGVYREIVSPERLVFTHMWLDAQGKPGPETVVTITLAEQGGQTLLTLHQSGFASIGVRDGHQVGWSSTLDRLAAHLETLS